LNRIGDLEAEVSAATSTRVRLSGEVESLEKTRGDLLVERDCLSNQLSESRSSLTGARATIVALEQMRDSLRSESEKIAQLNAILDKTRVANDAALTDGAQRLADVTAERDALTAQLFAVSAEFAADANAIKALENRLLQAHTALEEAQCRIGSLSSEASDLMKVRDQLSGEIEKLAAIAAGESAQVTALETELSQSHTANESAAQKAHERIANLEEQLASSATECKELTSEITVLQSAAASYVAQIERLELHSAKEVALVETQKRNAELDEKLAERTVERDRLAVDALALQESLSIAKSRFSDEVAELRNGFQVESVKATEFKDTVVTLKKALQEAGLASDAAAQVAASRIAALQERLANATAEKEQLLSDISELKTAATADAKVIGSLTEQKADLETAVSNLTDSVRDLKLRIANDDERICALASEVLSATKSRDCLSEEVCELKSQVNAGNARIRILEQNCNDLTNDRDRLRVDVRELAGTVDAAQAQIADLTAVKTELEKMVFAPSSECDELSGKEDELSALSFDPFAQIAGLENTKAEMAKAISSLTIERDRLWTEVSELTATVARQFAGSASVQQSKAELEIDFATLTAERDWLLNELTKTNGAVGGLEGQVADLAAQAANLELQLQQAAERLQQQEIQLSALASECARLGGEEAAIALRQPLCATGEELKVANERATDLGAQLAASLAANSQSAAISIEKEAMLGARISALETEAARRQSELKTKAAKQDCALREIRERLAVDLKQKSTELSAHAARVAELEGKSAALARELAQAKCDAEAAEHRLCAQKSDTERELGAREAAESENRAQASLIGQLESDVAQLRADLRAAQSLAESQRNALQSASVRGSVLEGELADTRGRMAVTEREKAELCKKAQALESRSTGELGEQGSARRLAALQAQVSEFSKSAAELQTLRQTIGTESAADIAEALQKIRQQSSDETVMGALDRARSSIAHLQRVRRQICIEDTEDPIPDVVPLWYARRLRARMYLGYVGWFIIAAILLSL
jgi:chromosome segregation ATPase